MGGQQAGCLPVDGSRSTPDEGQDEHGVGKVFAWDGDDKEVGFEAAVVLRVGVGESEDER